MRGEQHKNRSAWRGAGRNHAFGKRIYNFGEKDIIAAKNGVLAFVEVKTRLFGSCGRGSESVTAAKRQKIRRCALCYISMCQRRFEAIDFQVVDINADHLEGLEF